MAHRSSAASQVPPAEADETNKASRRCQTATAGIEDRLAFLQGQMAVLQGQMADTLEQLRTQSASQERQETMQLKMCNRLGIDVPFPAASSAIGVSIAASSSIASPLLALKGLTMHDKSAASSVHSAALSAATNSSVKSGQKGVYLP